MRPSVATAAVETVLLRTRTGDRIHTEALADFPQAEFSRSPERPEGALRPDWLRRDRRGDARASRDRGFVDHSLQNSSVRSVSRVAPEIPSANRGGPHNLRECAHFLALGAKALEVATESHSLGDMLFATARSSSSTYLRSRNSFAAVGTETGGNPTRFREALG